MIFKTFPRLGSRCEETVWESGVASLSQTRHAKCSAASLTSTRFESKWTRILNEFDMHLEIKSPVEDCNTSTSAALRSGNSLTWCTYGERGHSDTDHRNAGLGIGYCRHQRYVRTTRAYVLLRRSRLLRALLAMRMGVGRIRSRVRGNPHSAGSPRGDDPVRRRHIPHPQKDHPSESGSLALRLHAGAFAGTLTDWNQGRLWQRRSDV